MAKTKRKTGMGKKDAIWNLKLLYSSAKDPAIEADMSDYEKACDQFRAKYDTPDKPYLNDANDIKAALSDYEELCKFDGKPYLYFFLLRDLKADNIDASAKISLIETRMAKAQSKITFFHIALGKISIEKQNEYLEQESLAHFHIFLKRIFELAKHMLTVPEENILSLKNITSNEMWTAANDKILSMKTIVWQKKTLPLARAFSLIPQTRNMKQRHALALEVNRALADVAPFSEAEINAVVTDKKIEDELRKYNTPEEATIEGYQNDPEVVERLIDVVTKNFKIAHRFYALKAKILKQKKLAYADRAVNIGNVQAKFSFEQTAEILMQRFGEINPIFREHLQQYLKKGQIDAKSKVGKTSGAYCLGTLNLPTFVLLNHNDDFRSFTTFAHEIGHAFHSELSKNRGPLYHRYSTSLAETASTLFESIARDTVMQSLSKKDRLVALHDKISDDIATIFRQIACYNMEKEMHAKIRTVGFASKEELCILHNKHMQAYLGPKFKLSQEEGLFFVQWGHIRRFFYVYTYAYGMLTSKALLRKFKADPSFWKSIEKFLEAGGKDSPENIMKEIGIDLKATNFFEEGIKEIESDIDEFEKLMK